MYMPITGACFLIAGIGCLLMAVVEFLSWCGVSGMPRIPAWAPWGAYFFLRGGDDRRRIVQDGEGTTVIPFEHALIWIGNESWYPVSRHATREEAAAAWLAKPERVRLHLHIATVRGEQ